MLLFFFVFSKFNTFNFHSGGAVCDGGVDSLTSSTPELVVMVGWPGSGKSTIAQRFMVPKGYVWVNQDTMKTPAKCLKAVEEALANGKSVVVDNTNPS